MNDNVSKLQNDFKVMNNATTNNNKNKNNGEDNNNNKQKQNNQIYQPMYPTYNPFPPFYQPTINPNHYYGHFPQQRQQPKQRFKQNMNLFVTPREYNRQGNRNNLGKFYCHTHGSCAHPSSQCQTPRMNHQWNATFNNCMGGSNKGCYN